MLRKKMYIVQQFFEIEIIVAAYIESVVCIDNIKNFYLGNAQLGQPCFLT